MTRVIAVGSPQTFRGQVARALEFDVEQVDWVPSVIAAEEYLGNPQQLVDLVVMSPGIKEADAIGFADFASRTTPATAVVLARDPQSLEQGDT